MIAKQWLNRARRLDLEIDILKHTREKVHDRVTSITQSYDSDGAQSSKDPHKFDRLIELDGLISERASELVRIKEEILLVINQLPDCRQRMVFISYYLGDFSTRWKDVEAATHYSESQVKRIKKAGYKEVEKLIGLNKDDPV